MGNGNSNSFSEVWKLDIHLQKPVKILEYVGHIKKRLGSKLQKLKSTK